MKTIDPEKAIWRCLTVGDDHYVVASINPITDPPLTDHGKLDVETLFEEDMILECWDSISADTIVRMLGSLDGEVPYKSLIIEPPL